jgi:homoserine dehydrogenase
LNEWPIFLVGLGVVGSATARLLTERNDFLASRAGVRFVIHGAAVADVHKPRPGLVPSFPLTNDPWQGIHDPGVRVVVELMGGTTTALEVVTAALRAGKHVVTANKALLAEHGEFLFRLAQEQGCVLAFEAAVAGSIPVIQAVRDGLAANTIDALVGIINGTSNFVLSRMRTGQLSFQEALQEARRLGYAEQNAALDVDGLDAAHKLALLARVAMGVPLRANVVYAETIGQVTQEDMAFAEALGYCIRQLAIARKTPYGIELRVHPALVRRQHLLAHVDGVMNAVLVHGDIAGANLYYGAGAGGNATASAVLADLIALGRQNAGCAALNLPQPTEELPVLPMAQIESAYYLRMQVTDSPGVMASLTAIMAEFAINVEAIIQREPSCDDGHVPLVFLTAVVAEARLQAALQRMQDLDVVLGAIQCIRLAPAEIL